MDLSNLKVSEGSLHSGKRVGRGLGSGMGKTSTRGQKGAGARSGGAIRPGFEGGQNPLYRRVPKRGFKNINRKEYAVVNLADLEACFNDGETVDLALYIKKPLDGVKVLGEGELTKKLIVIADKFSASAKEKIEKVGGEAKER
ncbi:MAG: 50S ribosomal protein L15 [Bacilli bacterium]|nr:50S ribosomal protein L15 [Bacilli bacterium]MCI7622133.1 50S ribosomal protein L15 [Bacilli bacterium]MDD6227377.1 50S ribosomal protein L15 [Bacilli bacterium]MDD7375219.1 50S ribosomal protein L15 [Bacilli bacterium]MDD7549165.1 50S ribosomal protein L15 [Bacilli bacterium]